MHLLVPPETQQVRKVDLNWTCYFHTGMERYVYELRFLVHISLLPEFWTYSGPVYWIFPIPLCEWNLSPYRPFGTDQSVTV